MIRSSSFRRLIDRATRAGGSSRRRFIVGSFVGQLVFTGIAFLGSVAIARMLGPAGRGDYTLWTLIAFGAALAATGSIPAGAGRRILDGGTPDEIYPPLVRHGLVAFAITTPFAIALAATGLASPWLLAAVLLVLVPATAVLEDLLVIARAEKDSRQFQGLRVLNAAVTTVIAAVLLVVVGSTTPSVAFGAFGAGTVVATVLGIVLLRRRRGQGADVRPLSLRRLQQLGAGSFSSTLFDRLLMRLDQIVVYLMLGPASLGIYGVARNWAEVAQAAAHSIGHGMFESTSTLSTSNALRLLMRGAAVVTALGLSTSLVGWLLIPLLFGEEFAEARWYVLLFLPAVVVRTIGFSGQEVLIAQGHGPDARMASGCALLVGVVAWIVGAATLGLPGVAAATSIAYGTQAGLVWWQLSRPR